jgi:hypothetical protein
MFCLPSVGYHLELRVAMRFYRHHHLLPTNLYHIRQRAYYLLMSFG